ncbi:hypothetical protein [Mesorhizobium sp.]|uniref:hypothetical protein n=1 Tax=Mesorhizobium sp. TaxID=1871066 RepID=UPI000FEA1E95|nr:hypothetical protein [Mesorhizobium sp.]RWP12547.1 MAG: hypothetical protein EOR00_26670 [Mesorhizobium sp.]RWP64212.1 MAG: hypothetical protein EOR07_16655 [Mesorhizobium sp.]RWQ03521.1 MAG: hypothetical protein EOR89_09550 [Mesorhizobium sp.]TJV45265.1 MAG: hypothetical protein E5Y16_05360 [Mesorhizobium sp.]
MTNSFSFGRMLLLLVVFGLALAPLGASPSSAAVAGSALSMQEEMPCCPDGRPMVPDCGKDCPLAVLCVVGVVTAPLPETLAFLLPAPVGDDFLNGRDVILPSLVGEPPPRPPKV